MRGMIAGNMNEPYRSARAGRKLQASNGAQQGAEYSQTASGFAAEDGVQYDVSSGRSRVAQLLSEQYGGADMYNVSVPKSGQGEATIAKTTEGTDTSVPQNGHTKKDTASTNTSVIHSGAVSKNGQTSDGSDLTMTGDEQAQNGKSMPWDDISEQDMESDLSYLENMLKRLQESRKNASKNNTMPKGIIKNPVKRVTFLIEVTNSECTCFIFLASCAICVA